VRRFIDKILGEILAYGDVSKDDPDHYIKTHGGNLITYLHRIAPTIKHPAFQAEQEWRVISRPLGSSRTQLAYRPGKSMVTPYYKIAVGKTSKPETLRSIRRIVLGPTPHPEISELSIRSLLSRERLQSFFGTDGEATPVDQSVIPYRAW
jgi:hypothetical protein